MKIGFSLGTWIWYGVGGTGSDTNFINVRMLITKVAENRKKKNIIIQLG